MPELFCVVVVYCFLTVFLICEFFSTSTIVHNLIKLYFDKEGAEPIKSYDHYKMIVSGVASGVNNSKQPFDGEIDHLLALITPPGQRQEKNFQPCPSKARKRKNGQARK